LHQKLGRVEERIIFLINCRHERLYPRFIVSKVPILHSSSSQRVRKQVSKLQSIMLGEEISDAYRHRAYLRRSLRRLERRLSCSCPDWCWLLEQCHSLLRHERSACRERLVKKFESLRKQNRVDSSGSCCELAPGHGTLSSTCLPGSTLLQVPCPSHLPENVQKIESPVSSSVAATEEEVSSSTPRPSQSSRDSTSLPVEASNLFPQKSEEDKLGDPVKTGVCSDVGASPRSVVGFRCCADRVWCAGGVCVSRSPALFLESETAV